MRQVKIRSGRTETQCDGRACMYCGDDDAPMRPVVTANGVQGFAHQVCIDVSAHLNAVQGGLHRTVEADESLHCMRCGKLIVGEYRGFLCAACYDDATRSEIREVRQAD